ncbi:MAG: hypothetical protein ACJA0Y_000562 [Maricaulis maris]|jgi:hypothetical protein
MSDEQLRLQMAMAWERAKGEMRSVAVAAGHRRLCGPMTVGHEKWCADLWQELDGRIEKFITDMEDEGMIE